MSGSAEEFGERVAKEWGSGHFVVTEKALSELASSIASELWSSHWVQVPALIGRLEAALGRFAEKEMTRVNGSPE